jgi:hypothetical protein
MDGRNRVLTLLVHALAASERTTEAKIGGENPASTEWIGSAGDLHGTSSAEEKRNEH